MKFLVFLLVIWSVPAFATEKCHLVVAGNVASVQNKPTTLKNCKFHSGISMLYARPGTVTQLEDDLFSGLGLSELELTRNPFKFLNGKAFRGSHVYGTLYLSFTQLSVLEQEDFQHLGTLDRLALYDNDLTTLPKDVFAHLTNVEVINLGKNELTAIPETLFGDNTKIAELYLYENQLTTLPDTFLHEVSSTLKYLSVHSNPIPLEERPRIEKLLPNTKIVWEKVVND